jgi:hypothetical protein
VGYCITLCSLSRRVLIRPERLAPHALLPHFPLPCTCFFGVARRHRRAFRGMNHPLIINPLGCVSLIRFPNVVRSWGRGSIFELNLCGCTNLGITKKPQPRIAKTRNFLLQKRINSKIYSISCKNTSLLYQWSRKISFLK